MNINHSMRLARTITREAGTWSIYACPQRDVATGEWYVEVQILEDIDEENEQWISVMEIAHVPEYQLHEVAYEVAYMCKKMRERWTKERGAAR